MSMEGMDLNDIRRSLEKGDWFRCDFTSKGKVSKALSRLWTQICKFFGDDTYKVSLVAEKILDHIEKIQYSSGKKGLSPEEKKHTEAITHLLKAKLEKSHDPKAKAILERLHRQQNPLSQLKATASSLALKKERIFPQRFFQELKETQGAPEFQPDLFEDFFPHSLLQENRSFSLSKDPSPPSFNKTPSLFAQQCPPLTPHLFIKTLQELFPSLGSEKLHQIAQDVCNCIQVSFSSSEILSGVCLRLQRELPSQNGRYLPLDGWLQINQAGNHLKIHLFAAAENSNLKPHTVRISLNP